MCVLDSIFALHAQCVSPTFIMLEVTRRANYTMQKLKNVVARVLRDKADLSGSHHIEHFGEQPPKVGQTDLGETPLGFLPNLGFSMDFWKPHSPLFKAFPTLHRCISNPQNIVKKLC